MRKGYAVYDFKGTQAVFTFATVSVSLLLIRKMFSIVTGIQMNKAARTVLNLLFHRLTTWLRPCWFTMEEVWPERFEGEDSLSISVISSTPGICRRGAAEKWSTIRATRRVVTAALEIQRSEKVIGASLEAAPKVFVKDKKMKDILTSVPFEDICITSSISVEVAEAPSDAFTLEGADQSIAVVFAKADGDKCQRCWKILPDVGAHTHAQTCARCNDALS